MSQVVRSSFQHAAFATLVHASEGNPRDAMNLASKAARAAGHRVIARRDADRILGGSLRWSNDGWAATRSFFVDDHDPDWRDAIVGRR